MKTFCFPRIKLLRNRLLVAAAMLLSPRALGQGTVNFSNVGLPNSFVYVYIPGLPEVKAPVGTSFSVALYWAPVDPLNPTVQPFASAFTQQGPSVRIAPFPGDYAGGVVSIAGISPPGGL